MKRHEWWRAQYRADAYMAHLDSAALKTRFENILGNTCKVTDDLKLGLLSSALKGAEATDFWGIAFTHLLEEYGARGSGLPSDFDKSLYECLYWPNVKSAIAPFQQSRQMHREVLVKYGKATHLREALDAGRVLINPASSYNDSSLNRALRDNELELTVYRRSKLHALLIDEHGIALKPAGPVFGVKTEVLRAPTNYYVYCTCMLRSVRMFGDFKVDGALVIHDVRRFVRRLGERVREHLGPGWSWSARPVKYIDPVRVDRAPLNVVECKHFAYTYQHEYRLIWVPDPPIAKLEPFFIDIDPVRDYSQLVELVSPNGG
jgi:hypothetical protein